MPHFRSRDQVSTSSLVVSMAPELLQFSDSLVDRLGYAALLHANPQAQEMLRRETAEHLNQALFRAFCSALPQEQVGRFIQMACNGAPIAARVAYLLEHVVKLDEVVLSVMLRVQRTHLAMTATPQGRHNQLVYLV